MGLFFGTEEVFIWKKQTVLTLCNDNGVAWEKTEYSGMNIFFKHLDRSKDDCAESAVPLAFLSYENKANAKNGEQNKWENNFFYLAAFSFYLQP